MNIRKIIEADRKEGGGARREEGRNAELANRVKFCYFIRSLHRDFIVSNNKHAARRQNGRMSRTY